MTRELRRSLILPALSAVVLLLVSGLPSDAQALGSPSCSGAGVDSCDLQSPANIYVGVEGYQTHNALDYISDLATTASLYGASSIGSDILYAGFSVHISSSLYSIDYLAQYYVEYTSSGVDSLIWALWVRCNGQLSTKGCGPEFGNCTELTCPSEAKLIDSGSTNCQTWAPFTCYTDDPVQIHLRWDSSSCGGSGPCGWVFDVKDTNYSPDDFTIATYDPTGNFATMLPKMSYGDQVTNCSPLSCNSPVFESYYTQVGFFFTGVLENSNWGMELLNTWYLPVGGSSDVYLDHATTLTPDWNTSPAFCPPSGSLTCYWSYWTETYELASYPAQAYGVSISGGGSSSENALLATWVGGIQNGDVSLW